MSMSFPSVPQLLSALFGLGSLTLVIVGFDAERLIGAVDDLKVAQQQDHTQVTLNTNAIAAVVPRVDALEANDGKQDTKLAVLEAGHQAPPPLPPLTTRDLNIKEERRHRGH